MLRFIDGFDYYDTIALFLRKWDYFHWDRAFGTAYGRNGSGGIRMTGDGNGGGQGKNLPAANSGYGFFGHALYTPNMGPGGRSIIHAAHNPALDSSMEIASWMFADGSLGVGWQASNSGGWTLLAQTGPGLISAANYRHVETGIRVHPANGEVIVRLDGDVVCSYTGNTARATGSSEFRQVRSYLNGGMGEQWMDDFYYCDDAGPKNNDFLGDMRIITLYPNAPGDLAEWSQLVGAATIWEATNQHPTDDDTSYVASDAPGERFLVNLDALTGVDGEVRGLAVNLMAKKDDAGTRKVSALVKVPSTGGAIGQATEQAFPSAYANLQYIFESNPDTGLDFTWPQIAELQAGGKITL